MVPGTHSQGFKETEEWVWDTVIRDKQREKLKSQEESVGNKIRDKIR